MKARGAVGSAGTSSHSLRVGLRGVERVIGHCREKQGDETYIRLSGVKRTIMPLLTGSLSGESR